MKDTPEGLQLKAGLVAHRFEENCLNKSDKESPTCFKDIWQTMLATAAHNDRYLRSIDIKTFLQGEKFNQNVFIKPSESNYSQNIWKLNKCVYSLSDASFTWYTRVKKFVTDSSSVISKIDHSLFIWCRRSGDNGFIESLIGKLQGNFVVGKMETKCFKYLGLNIKH